MGYMTKSKLLDIFHSGKPKKMGPPKMGSRQGIDDELDEREPEGEDEHDLDHYASGTVDESEDDGGDDDGEPMEDGDGFHGDDGEEETEAGPSDDDDHAVVGDLVQSGLTHEQSIAIIDAIRALSQGPSSQED